MGCLLEGLRQSKETQFGEFLYFLSNVFLSRDEDCHIWKPSPSRFFFSEDLLCSSGGKPPRPKCLLCFSLGRIGERFLLAGGCREVSTTKMPRMRGFMSEDISDIYVC